MTKNVTRLFQFAALAVGVALLWRWWQEHTARTAATPADSLLTKAVDALAPTMAPPVGVSPVMHATAYGEDTAFIPPALTTPTATPTPTVIMPTTTTRLGSTPGSGGIYYVPMGGMSDGISSDTNTGAIGPVTSPPPPLSIN